MTVPRGDAPDFVRLPTPRLLQTIQTVPGSTGHNYGPFNASNASQAILIAWNVAAIETNPPGIDAISVTDPAGNTLLNFNLGPPQITVPQQVFPYFEVVNNGFSINVLWDVAPTVVQDLAHIYELDTAPGGWVYTLTGTRLPVDLNVTSFAPLPVELDAANATVTVQGSTFAVPAVGVNIQPEVPGALCKGFASALAVNATGVWIPGVAGKRISLYQLTWGMSSGATPGVMNGAILDSNTTVYDQIRADVPTAVGMVASPVHSSNMRGVALPLGSGLNIKNVGTIVADFDGTVVYTQV